MTNHHEYAEYLKKRSTLAAIYRKKILYPRISHLLEGKLLDVGCGIGDMLAFRPNTVGVDVNPYNVEFCHGRRLEAYTMPFDSIPFGDHCFDSVLLDNVLEHIADPTSLLLEIKRVLRPSGVLVVGVPGLRGYEADADHKVYYDETALEDLAVQWGFEIGQSVYAPLFRSNWMSRVLSQYCIYVQWKHKKC